MKKLSARRRHPLAALVVLLFALAATGGLYAALAPQKAQAEDTSQQSLAIEQHAHGPPAPLDQQLHVDELEAVLRGQGLRELPNLFSDFQIETPGERQKTEWSRQPHSWAAGY